MSKLYLIPSPLSTEDKYVYPKEVLDIINSLKVFIVENAKPARHNLRQAGYKGSFDEITLYEWDKHFTEKNPITTWLKVAKESGESLGLLSDAGCPGVADPGAEVILAAHEMGIEVEPLLGPSSILMALMASGLNGQSFAFNGYLPQKKDERVKKLKEYEAESRRKNQTQIFIETPYRNEALLEDIKSTLNASTLLCIAVNISSPDQDIRTMRVKEWKQQQVDLNKQPAVFLFLSR